MELIKPGLDEPEAESRPSKQVALLESAALRKVLASDNFWEFGEFMEETEFFKEEIVIWWSSWQSRMVPFCDSTRFEEKRLFVSFSDWEIAVCNVWKRKLRMSEVKLWMEIESFKELRHEFGYGVDLQKDLMEEEIWWRFWVVVEEEDEWDWGVGVLLLLQLGVEIKIDSRRKKVNVNENELDLDMGVAITTTLWRYALWF